jgi:hypothetical protein
MREESAKITLERGESEEKLKNAFGLNRFLVYSIQNKREILKKIN